MTNNRSCIGRYVLYIQSNFLKEGRNIFLQTQHRLQKLSLNARSASRPSIKGIIKLSHKVVIVQWNFHTLFSCISCIVPEFRITISLNTKI